MAVKVGNVAGIEISFIGLKVVALVKNLRDQHVPRWGEERLVGGKKRRFAGSHVGENDPGVLFARIGGLVHFLAESLFRRFARLFETTAMSIIKPSMVEAAQAAVFYAAIAQVCAPMRAVLSQRAG